MKNKKGNLKLAQNTLTGSIPIVDMLSLTNLGAFCIFFVFGATLFFFAHKHALCVCVCARHTEKLDVFHNFLTGSIPTEIGQLSTIGEFMPLCYAPSACILVVVLLLLLFGTALIPLFFNSRAHVSCPRSALAWTKPNRRSHSIHNGSLDQTR